MARHPFDQWWDSDENPLRGSSDTVVHFVKPAMRASFRAGGQWAINGVYEHLGIERRSRGKDDPFEF